MASRGLKPRVPDWSPAGISAVTTSPRDGMSSGALHVSDSAPSPRCGGLGWAAAAGSAASGVVDTSTPRTAAREGKAAKKPLTASRPAVNATTMLAPSRCLQSCARSPSSRGPPPSSAWTTTVPARPTHVHTTGPRPSATGRQATSTAHQPARPSTSPATGATSRRRRGR